ncbi:MAG TPA: hypothetical protein VID28_20755 [Methylomirabilota bacterium]|jgi:hypothetical protein
MKRVILAVVVVLAVVPIAEGQRRSTTNRDWLQWPQSERAAYFLGFADATSALAGLTCPSDSTLAVGLIRAEEYARENPDMPNGAAAAVGLQASGCRSRGAAPPPADK